uniref:Uncharacterized protein n=1 Tax=Octopus bimaculoides TaxID=37653 RepID=A0A0L8HVB9_OCTBM
MCIYINTHTPLTFQQLMVGLEHSVTHINYKGELVNLHALFTLQLLAVIPKTSQFLCLFSLNLFLALATSSTRTKITSGSVKYNTNLYLSSIKIGCWYFSM